MSLQDGKLSCDMLGTVCAEPVTHIDENGWVYCTTHGVQRQKMMKCRQLTKSEKGRLLAGLPLPYSRNSRFKDVPAMPERTTSINTNVTIVWEERAADSIDGPALYASIRINGCIDLHLEAIEVKTNKEGEQEAVDDAWVEDLQYLQERGDGAVEAFEYKGKTYTLLATTFGD